MKKEIETVTISVELFDQLATAAELIAKGSRPRKSQRDAWREIVQEARAIRDWDAIFWEELRNLFN